MVALLSHIRMNLMFPDNHSKEVVELTVRQKKEIDSELTTQRVQSQIGSKAKVKRKFRNISPKTNRKELFQRKSFPSRLFSKQQIQFPRPLIFNLWLN